ncbi:serine hydrolase domain-containing protein [Cohnella lupini]|uniref:CubicO group peptidase (Beta-lactamase class C family) n=1 Tax=Cohnella lupini TaxID=1294267 RepID=A0A3D9I0W1_9BACL|nr:serine hydrolase [Cohnella lupini]RED55280.1 CubicO group peptidase (beta-lactamase class C family) [Cohnella lupini]
MNFTAWSHEVEAYDLSSCIIHYQGEPIYHYEKSEQASSRLMPINSCTKSVLSALICIAMEQGLVASTDTLISRYFPQLLNDKDARKKSITLEHLLTLTAGFRWNEFGGLNSFPQMSRSPDWISYVLEQPLSDEPGTRMVYNSGVSQLLAAILAQATGMDIARYAELNLFSPLGIEQYDWKRDPQGIHTGGFGLQLTAHDMLKFGLLYLHQGVWNHRQLISRSLVERSTKPAIAVKAPERGFYGWHWWSESVSELDFYYARGFGGQFIIIVPTLDAVVVLTRKQRKKGLMPLDLFRQRIAPFLIEVHAAGLS